MRTLALLTLSVVVFSGSILAQSGKDTNGYINSKKEEVKDASLQNSKQLRKAVDLVPSDSTSIDSLKNRSRKYLKRNARKLAEQQHIPKEAEVKFENGNWSVPENPLKKPNLESLEVPSDLIDIENTVKLNTQLPEIDIPEHDSLFNLRRVDSLKTVGKESYDSIHQHFEKVKARSEALVRFAENPQEELTNRVNHIVQEGKAYSTKRLKELYDSMGISKLDTILAQLPIKHDVTEEDLIQRLNESLSLSQPKFPTTKEDFLTASELDKLTEGYSLPDMSSLKLPDSIANQLPAIPGRKLDAKYLAKFDSLRDAYLDKERLRLKEQELTEKVKQAALERKPTFWDRIYFEGLVTFNSLQERNEIQVAPAVGVKLAKNFSLGIGPNILLREDDRKIQVTAGYRSFAKYEVFNQRAYLQVEDIVDPRQVSLESAGSTRHSILAGGGVLVPVSKVLAINMMLLYRVNNEEYSAGIQSPFTFRVGISTLGNKKSKTIEK
ncbi:MAG: hypothetical protein KF846_13705 [Cyclobacteriaceae bacterium]|nr:hypothetical protein [Cyclobacteriaceae bacterium]MBX2957213.1 hypothetical protein [Cyclobacteriaceae bacterium]